MNTVFTLILHSCNMQFIFDLHLYQEHFSFCFSNYSILCIFRPHVKSMCPNYVAWFELFTLIIFDEVSNYLLFYVTQLLSFVFSFSYSQIYSIYILELGWEVKFKTWMQQQIYTSNVQYLNLKILGFQNFWSSNAGSSLCLNIFSFPSTSHYSTYLSTLWLVTREGSRFT
jgi:hypothetical protein